MEQLKAENLNYLMQALHLLHPLPTLPEEKKKTIEKFMPKLLQHTQLEMYRYNCDDVIVTIEAY
jgi:hypothetical protein